jgi:hypothetical protein
MGQVYHCSWRTHRELNVFFPGSNITCSTFHIHLWPIYWLSFVLSSDLLPGRQIGIFSSEVFSRSSCFFMTWFAWGGENSCARRQFVCRVITFFINVSSTSCRI